MVPLVCWGVMFFLDLIQEYFGYTLSLRVAHVLKLALQCILDSSYICEKLFRDASVPCSEFFFKQTMYTRFTKVLAVPL